MMNYIDLFGVDKCGAFMWREIRIEMNRIVGISLFRDNNIGNVVI